MAQDKKSAEAVKQEVAHLKQQIEVLKERARELGRAFASLDEDQLTKKVKGETARVAAFGEMVESLPDPVLVVIAQNADDPADRRIPHALSPSLAET